MLFLYHVLLLFCCCVFFLSSFILHRYTNFHSTNLLLTDDILYDIAYLSNYSVLSFNDYIFSTSFSVFMPFLHFHCCFLLCCMVCRRSLAMRILLIRPSVCRPIVTKLMKNMSRFLYRTKNHLAYFSEKKNGWWGATPSTGNFGSTGPHWSEITDFELIIARSASAVTPSEKSSINTQ